MNFQTKNLLPLFTFLFFTHSIFAQQPNVLFIIVDDIGVGPIPNYEPNSTKANMPHLEAMMNEGITFDNVWSNPVCAPSRANILTGKHGFRTNVLNAESLSTLSQDETTLHEYIEQSSNGTYSNSLIGKWHLGGGGGMNANLDYPNESGIDYFGGIIGGGVQDYNDYDLVINGQSTATTDYITTKFTDLAIDWINDQNQPWFCWLAYNAAHTPFHLPPTNMHTQGNLPTDSASIADNPLPYYLAMIESLDFEMGRLFDNIPESELENTVIIFVGDNGTPGAVVESPYQSNRAKGSLYQGGVHVPMVISGVGVNRANEREDALVSFSDLFSTMVELTGTSLSQIHDSYSFAPLLAAQGDGQRECMYTEVQSGGNSDGWASRNETYKYISLANGGERFYNLIVDPYESNNLLPVGTLSAAELIEFDKLSNHFDVISPVADLEKETFGFKIFPNPAGDNLFLEMENFEKQYFYIFDISGKEMKRGEVTFENETISINDLNAGMYFIQVGGEVKKFVKE
ncbi:MAG: arylsulfatase A-like enzyme [Granulosicoccus sp.]|jgi:arylsulfatase A-like enzyme